MQYEVMEWTNVLGQKVGYVVVTYDSVGMDKVSRTYKTRAEAAAEAARLNAGGRPSKEA